MIPKSKLEQVIEILRQKGRNEMEIKQFLENLTTAGMEHLFKEATENFTEEDKSQLNEIKDPELFRNKVLETYQLRTGKIASDEIDKFVEQFADEFLAGKDYKK